MKLIDVATVQGRVNSIVLKFEPIEHHITECDEKLRRALIDLKLEIRELQAGLDFYAETNPQTIAPGLVKRRAAKKSRRRRK